MVQIKFPDGKEKTYDQDEVPVLEVVESLGERWRRVCLAEAISWIRSHRVPATDHARNRVAEVIEREGRAVR